ncbi:MAG: hypothetical protein U0R80_13100 [Nocardioidaceae bacterium]
MGLSRRVKSLLLVGLLVLMINVPLVQSTVLGRRIASGGEDVTALVVDRSVSGTDERPTYVVSARLPTSIDPDRTVLSARVDKATYDAAGAAGTVVVRVLPSQPTTAYRFTGQTHSRQGLWLTLGTDAVLAALVLLLWRTGRYRGRDHLRLEATADLVAGGDGRSAVLPEGAATGDHVQLAGVLLEASEHEALLDLGDRTAHVLLDGHACDGAVGDSMVARGRLLE